MDAERIVNWTEVFLWILIGLVFGWRAARARGRGRWQPAVLAVTFLAFGASDLVEMRTGSWWKPWWLLVWKVGCAAVMMMAYLAYRRRKAGSQPAPD